MKYVEWAEPWNLKTRKDGSIPTITVISRMTTKDAIKWMKYTASKHHSEHPNYPYKSNKEALEDFLTIYWATIVEVPDVCPG